MTGYTPTRFCAYYTKPMHDIVRCRNALIVLFSSLVLLIGEAACALSFISFDPRSMGLGNTGVAFARPSKAPLFNPALLSTNYDADRNRYSFSIHSGARLFDRDGFIDGVRHYQDNDAETAFRNAMADFNAKVDSDRLTVADFDRLSAASNDFLDDVANLSNRPLRMGGSVGVSVARTGRWGIAGFVHTFAVAGSIIDFEDMDRTITDEILQFGRSTLEVRNLIRPYSDFVRQNSSDLQAAFDFGGIEALQEELRDLLASSNLADDSEALVSLMRSYYDIYLAGDLDIQDIAALTRLPNLKAQFRTALELQGSLITESGASFSRRVSERHGLSFGVTLKVLRFETIDYRARVVDATSENFRFREHRTTYSDPNVDLGVTGTMGDQIRWGIVLRNGIPRDFRTIRGNIIKLRPQARLSIAVEKSRFTVAADLDLTRNEPLGFDSDKQFLGVGVERKWSRWNAGCGLRYNLADNSALISLGGELKMGRTRVGLAAAGAEDTVGVALHFEVGF